MQVTTTGAAVEIDGTFTVKISGAGVCPADSSFALPLTLLPAMLTGEPLDISGNVSDRLLRSASEIQDIFGAWVPNTKRSDIHATRHPTPIRSSSLALFFSGGVDSLASLIRLKDSVCELIAVHGFDVPASESATFARCLDGIQAGAEVFHKPLRVVKTNLREWSDLWFKNHNSSPWSMYHGAALAAVGLALRASHVVVGSSYSYAQLHPWGSHPLLDPLWSTEGTDIFHDGTELTRVDKLLLIARFPALLDNIRVCWIDSAAYNCGRCEKCLRTMIALEGLGKLTECRAFPVTTVDPGLVRDVRVDESAAHHWRELLALPLRPELRRAVLWVLHNQEYGLPPRGIRRVAYKGLRAWEIIAS